MSERIRRILSHRRLPLLAAALAVALTLPSLNTGWLFDDYYQRMTLLRPEPYRDFLPSRLDIFRFMDGDPARMRRAMDQGLMPWWSYERVKGAFCRPIAAATHWLDYQFWPNRPAMMHLHSILWWAGAAAAVAMLYRGLMGATAAAGLAAILYVIDDARGMPVAFLANRNALLGVLFAVCALMAHHRWRSRGWRPGLLVGPVTLLAALLSAEAAAGVLAYLLAYALTLDRGPWRRRLGSLLPYAVVVAGWRIVWVSLGYGVHGTGVYADPGAGLMAFAATIAFRLPIILLGQWAYPPADVASFVGPPVDTWMCVGGLVLMGLLAAVCYPLLRRDRTARFWALGMLLATVPAGFTLMNRQLFFVGLGAFGLLAQLLAGVFGRHDWRPGRLPWRILATVVLAMLIPVHLLAAPLTQPIFAAYPMPPQLMQGLHDLPGLDESVEGKMLVIVNHPLPAHVVHMLAGRAVDRLPLPARVRLLAPAGYGVTVRRPDARTLIVCPRRGYLPDTFTRICRGPQFPMALGEKVQLTGMTVEVTALTPDNRPAEAVFRFDRPLEDDSLRWVSWRNGAFRPCRLPSVGETLVLPPMRSPFVPAPKGR